VTELAGGGRRRCARVGRGIASERGLFSGRGASGTYVEMRGGGDDDGGREARRRFGGKRLSANLEGNRASIEPPLHLLSRVVF
jgi:hypothetical protein